MSLSIQKERRRSVRDMKKILPILLNLFLFLLMTISGYAQEPSLREYPYMRPDRETLHKWLKDYEKAPKAFIDRDLDLILNQALTDGFETSINLGDFLDYIPSERDQLNCGDCWVWASTGVMEIALGAQYELKDRLSIQYLQSCITDTNACCGGTLDQFVDLYNQLSFSVPWSNENASFQDGSRPCDNNPSSISCDSISTILGYPITSIQGQTIPTTGVGQSTAIANIKNVLHQGKGVYFGFYLSDFRNFSNFWGNEPEATLWSFDPYCGQTWGDQSGGHAVLIVGYDDNYLDPKDHYWIVLNSWGITSGRPTGLFRMPMVMNYDCLLRETDGSTFYALQFQTLDIQFGITETPLSKGLPLNDSVTAETSMSTMKYYYVDIADEGANLVIDVYNLSADADLNVRAGFKPTLSDYGCRSWKAGTISEQCRFTLPSPGRWWIGIDNYDTGTISYTIKANWEDCSPGSLTYTTPSNGATNQPTDVNLDWGNSSEAASYDVYFGTTSPPPFLVNKTLSGHDPGPLNNGMTYYWKIVAKNSCGSTSGPMWSFSTLACPTPGAPSLVSPSNGATGVSTTPTLNWSDVTGATSYDVQVCGDSGCSSLVRSANVAGSQWTVSSALNQGAQYWWRARANNACGSGSWTGTWNLTTTAAASISLLSPTNGAVFDSSTLITKYQPSFSWTESGTVTKCTILFSTSSIDFATPIAKGSASGAKDSWAPSISIWKKLMSASNNSGVIRNIYWKVIGTLPNRSTVESEVWSFKIDVPQRVIINSPADGAPLPSAIPPTFGWQTNGNVKFKLEISSLADFSTSTKIKSFNYTIRDPNIETTLNKTLPSFQWNTVEKLVGTGTGYFRIKAWDGINRETVSEVRWFTID
jgi:C1A family cysteine protease